jgi:hypothetical protein
MPILDVIIVPSTGPSPDHYGALIVPGLSAGRIPSAEEIAAAEEACEYTEVGYVGRMLDPETLEWRSLLAPERVLSSTVILDGREARFDVSIEGVQGGAFSRHPAFPAFCAARVRAGLDLVAAIADPAVLARVARELAIEIPASRPDAIAIAHALDAEAAMSRAIEKAPSREGAQGL